LSFINFNAMKRFDFNKLLPHLAAIAFFVLVAVIYCKPALEGQVLQQSDIIHWKGMSKDIQDYRDSHGGVAPLWTTSMFGGMPGFQIATNNNNYLSYYANEAFSLFIPKPFRFFILACLGFYFLALVLGASPWLATLGALGYSYASYNGIIISVGHDTKMLSIAYMPALLGAVWMIFERRFWSGAALTALFSSILIFHNHYQIVYYFLLIAAFMTIGRLVTAIRQRETGRFLAAAGIALGAGFIGILANAVMLFTTYDYSKATIRGGQASLKTGTDSLSTVKSNGGLDTAYAFLYGSYGVAESFTLLVPDMYGGGSDPLGEESKLVETMQQKGLPQQLASQLYSYFPGYWGNQPGHAGPVYLGAIFVFLFIFGMFFLQTPHKWWILALTIFSLFMSWGKNFGTFNNLMFEYLPFYNKFRAPAMILVIPQLLFPMVSVMALQRLFAADTNKSEVWKSLRLSGLVLAGCFLVLGALYAGFEYIQGYERSLQQQLSQLNPQDPGLGKDIIDAVVADRRGKFGSDLVRSLVLAGLGWLMLFLFIRNKVSRGLVIWSLLGLTMIDLLGVSSRYLSKDNFMEPEDFEGAFTPTQADEFIKQDPDQHFRVLNLTQSTFNDAITSYHHKSVGGYHAAKLSIYQDLIEHQLSKQPMNLAVLNMLNTRYVITQDSTGQIYPSRNPAALGNVWFVREIQYVKDAAAEMKALDQFDPQKTAVVQESYRASVNTPVADSGAVISLTKDDHDIVTYSSNSSAPQFAVFSEVFYDRGWKAFINGQETPIVKVNYVLRGLSIPAGRHAIEFRFEPASYYNGRRVTTISQVILALLLLAAIVTEMRRKPEVA
jgi:Bacterial membrane protein YfhO